MSKTFSATPKQPHEQNSGILKQVILPSTVTQALQDMEEGEGGIQAAGAQGQDQHQHNHHHHDHWEIKLFKYLNLNIVVFNQCCRRPNHHIWSVQSCWSLLPAFQSSFDDHSSPAWVRHWSYCAHPLSKSTSSILVVLCNRVSLLSALHLHSPLLYVQGQAMPRIRWGQTLPAWAEAGSPRTLPRTPWRTMQGVGDPPRSGSTLLLQRPGVWTQLWGKIR